MRLVDNSFWIVVRWRWGWGKAGIHLMFRLLYYVYTNKIFMAMMFTSVIAVRVYISDTPPPNSTISPKRCLTLKIFIRKRVSISVIILVFIGHTLKALTQHLLMRRWVMRTRSFIRFVCWLHKWHIVYPIGQQAEEITKQTYFATKTIRLSLRLEGPRNDFTHA